MTARGCPPRSPSWPGALARDGAPMVAGWPSRPAIADAHGGRLAAAPADRGARLVLELPAVDAGSGADPGDPGPSAQRSGHRGCGPARATRARRLSGRATGAAGRAGRGVGPGTGTSDRRRVPHSDHNSDRWAGAPGISFVRDRARGRAAAHRSDGTEGVLQRALAEPAKCSRVCTLDECSGPASPTAEAPVFTGVLARPERPSGAWVGQGVGIGLHCGREWVTVGAACGTRVAGLLPPSHPGSDFGRRMRTLDLPRNLRTRARREAPADGPRQVPRRPGRRSGAGRLARDRARARRGAWRSGRPDAYDAYTSATLAGLNPSSPKARDLKRFFFNSSFDAELDSANRVMIPHLLMSYAGLDKDVVVTGSGECLEVWDRSRYTQNFEDVLTRIPDIAASLGDTA